MADVQDANTQSEPSMEEILASIRKIIADEKDPAAAPAEEPAKEDVLELTQMVQDDGSVVNVKSAEPESIPEPEPMPEPISPPPEPVMNGSDKLVSDLAASAATSSLSALANTVQIERRVAPSSFTPLGNGGRTLEDMVLELMRPMLKDWLDQNLPPIVDRIVQKEVERIARRVQE